MNALTGGASLLLGALLVTAGFMKVVRADDFRLAVARLVPETWRHSFLPVAVRGLGWLELLVGAAVISAPVAPRGVALGAQAACAFLYLGFIGVVGRAIRVGARCGCFSSLSDGPSGGAELGRAMALGILAVVALVARLDGWAALRPTLSMFAWTGVLALGVASSAAVGSRVWRASAEGKGITLARPRPTARIGSAALFLLGHITTWRLFAGPPVRAELAQDQLEAILKALDESPGGTSLAAGIREGSGRLFATEIDMGPALVPPIRYFRLTNVTADVPDVSVWVALVEDDGAVVAVVGEPGPTAEANSTLAKPADGREIGQSLTT